MTLTNSGGQLMAGRQHHRGAQGRRRRHGRALHHVQRGLVGVVVAQNATLGDDTKVLLKPTGAAALGAGFGAGAIAGLLLAGPRAGPAQGQD